MPLTGDFASLRQLGNRLDRFNFQKVTKAVGGESAVQYSADFAGQRDPWGDAWSNKSGKAPVNRLTGALSAPSLAVAAPACPPTTARSNWRRKPSSSKA